ncbi:MAG: TetR/AcrR family transcriptional regulator [Acidimicrobiia bacterium]|nr:TetR/AcrR family transcriptional regulator [Acidimicrobiia bacterium]
MPSPRSASPSTPAAEGPRPLRPAGHKRPKTARGERTRRAILDAALEVFARDGFVAARVVDVAREAGVALGSVYTYFDDKRDVLAALLEGVFDELYEGSRAPLTGQDRSGALTAGLRHYLETYARHRRLMALLMEATAVDGRFAEYWFSVRSRFLERIVRALDDVRRAGRLDLEGDLVLAGSALGGMVDNFAWIWFGLGGERLRGRPARADVTVDEAAALLSRLWLRALFLEDGSARPDATRSLAAG